MVALRTEWNESPTISDGMIDDGSVRMCVYAFYISQSRE